MPATTAGVLQSGSSEELANALAGLTQMVSTARGMPRQQQPADRDYPAVSQPTAAAAAGPDGVQELDVTRMGGSQAAQSSGRGVRGNDENDAAARSAEEGALSRPTKRARIGPQPGMSGSIGASQQDAGEPPMGAVSEAEPGRGLPAWEAGVSTGRSSQQPAASNRLPNPNSAAGGPRNPVGGVRAIISAEGASAASLHLHVLPPEEYHAEAGEGHLTGSPAGGAEAKDNFSDTQNRQLRSILRYSSNP